MTMPMYAHDYTPAAGHPASLSFTAAAAPVGPTGLVVTSGQLLMVDANGHVLPATAAASQYVGVAGNDAFPGGQVTVLTGAGVIHETAVSGADIAAAAFVNIGGSGQVVTAAAGANNVGVCVRGGSAGDPVGPPIVAPVACRWLSYK
jgi:hypothetical protein